MQNTVDHVRLVRQAQLGDKESLARLSEMAEQRLRIDVFRLTLREELTEDVVQECLFEMLRVLRDLRDPSRFWAWLYKIALNKIRLHYRSEQRRKAAAVGATERNRPTMGGEQALTGAISEELRGIIIGAMRQLKPRHRAVLMMRCYREMDYSQIAESMGCSEFAAKMLFFRAKKALRKQLSRFGFGKASLLPGLLVFGRLTAGSEASAAQVSVSAASLQVGAAAGLLGYATTKAVLLSLGAAGLLAAGAAVMTAGSGRAPVGATGGPAVGSAVAPVHEGIEEYWCYYPRGVDGPVMMRLVQWDLERKRSYCRWLQNESAVYFFDADRNTVYIRNHRMWRSDLGVWRLPTDEPQLRDFLCRVEGRAYGWADVAEQGPGLLVISRHRPGRTQTQVTRYFNTLEEQYFLYNWPAQTRKVDARDAMHKRGWARFAVRGRLGQEQVRGRGLIAFTYEAFGRFSPWLELKVGDDLVMTDSGGEARLCDGLGRVLAVYEGGSFFAGLSRPWMGLHTIDTVRRDAARRRVWFETELKRDGRVGEVVLRHGGTSLVYTIDMEKDVIESIAFEGGGAGPGRLEFVYEQGEGLLEKYEPVGARQSGRRRSPAPGVLWLFGLANDELDQKIR